jgi:hypothetical protein
MQMRGPMSYVTAKTNHGHRITRRLSTNGSRILRPLSGSAVASTRRLVISPVFDGVAGGP